ncbi:MAG: light-harvesting protein [Gammaproteobacteria bacterium]|nr:light-harvesting protein [Gammaproteobacteria bacterium]NNL99960.1 light-harvesting protein [Gammaproteobacteria bacterium]
MIETGKLDNDEFCRREAKQFHLIYAACFAVFLVVAIVSRLLPRSWRPRLPGARARRTIIGEAREAADTFVPFAFMA